MGLALVKELAAGHGGAVAVTSELGKGSTFEVTLPVLPSADRLARGAAQAANGRAPMRLRPQTPTPFPPPIASLAVLPHADAPVVLVAEDNPDLRTQTAELLAPHYQVRLVENGKQALEVLAKEPVDLVLSDLVMPGVDGLELCRRMRTAPTLALVPFVLITAVNDVHALSRALDAGADDFLVKPFNEAELLARVRAQLRVRELAKLVAEASRLATMGSLLSDMSHELRNPINVLVNGLAPLRESLKEAEARDPTVAALLDALQTAADRVSGLSRELLTFRRDVDEAVARVRVPELIEQSLALLRPKLGGISLSKRIGYEGEVRGSAQVLGQVVVNLVENAIQATSGKGSVVIEARPELDGVAIEIWDDGPGVAPENRDRIFEPFFSTKRPGEGTGLGLAISRQIAERHGGHLALADSDRGARFRLTLPRAAP